MSIHDQAIQSAEELHQWFFNQRKSPNRDEIWFNGIFVTAAIRREIMCSVNQGKITIDGKVSKIYFDNYQGGVFKAFLKLGKL